MRFLHTADWHLGRVYHGLSLLEDQARVLKDFIRLADDVRPDAILIAGDVYDRSVPPADAVRLLDVTLTRLVVELRIPVVVIAGNHDGPDRLGFGSGMLERAGLTICGPVSAEPRPVVLRDAHGEVAIYPLPYAEPAMVRSLLGDDALDDHQAALAAQLQRIRSAHVPGRRSVVVAHAFVVGGAESDSERPLSVGGSAAVAAGIFDGFDYVALGHLHRPQQAGSPRIHYAGSLLKYSFAEVDHSKSVNLVELDATGGCTVERLALPPWRDLRVIEGALDEIIAAAATDAAREDYILARLSDRGALLDAMGKLRTAYPNALAIERPALEGEGSGRAGADHRRVRIQDLFASFYAEVSGCPMEEVAMQTVQTLVDRLEQEARQA